MNRKSLIASLLALVLAAPAVAPAFAQGPHNRGPHHQAQRGPDRHTAHRPAHRPAYRPPAHRPGYRPPAHARPPIHVGRGAGPRHDMYRGQRLPAYYRGQRYAVRNWRMHHLSPPPRGYYWVQTGTDYLLVAVATGLIAQIVLH